MRQERGFRIKPAEFTVVPTQDGDRIMFRRRRFPLPNPFLAGDMVRECLDTREVDWETFKQNQFRRERELANERGIAGKDGD